MFANGLFCRVSKRATVSLKYTGYVASSLLTVALSTQLALAAGTCEERYNELNDKYGLAYTNLANECWPSFNSEEEAAAFVLSPECVEKYNILGTEANDSYGALFTECQEVLFPAPTEQTPAEQPPVSQPTDGSPEVTGPTEVTIPSLSKKCEERLTSIGDKFSAAYVNLDAECYPADGAAWCGYQLSPACVERYQELNKESNDTYYTFYEECYGPGWAGYLGITKSPGINSVEKNQSEARASTVQVTAAPTKKEMLQRIKSLQKQLRRAKAKNKKMRARCSR